MNKLLSVIIPAYNCESTIKQAIMSTGVYQSDNVEVIVFLTYTIKFTYFISAIAYKNIMDHNQINLH